MTANTAQSEAWNGDEGQYFVAQRARHERMGQQHTARLLATAAIGPAEVVLDVGCGCGETTNGAARPARSGRALGVDLSAVMLAEARRLAGREGVRNARFEQADAQVHAFPAAGFDVAISGFGVMFFADPHAAFANIAAALRPGGRLAFLCWQEMTANEWLTVPFAAVAAHVTLPELPAADEPGPCSLADPRHAGRCWGRPPGWSPPLGDPPLGATRARLCGRRPGEAGVVSYPGHDGADVRAVEQAGVGDQSGEAAEDLGGQVAEHRGPGGQDDPGQPRLVVVRLAGEDAGPQRAGLDACRDGDRKS